MTQAVPEVAEMPYSRKGDSATAAVPINQPTLLTPIMQSGTVDVSDLAGLDPVALQLELVRRAAALRPMLDPT